MCRQEGEKINHLLNECKFVDEIWKKGENIFKRYDRVSGKPNLSISNWEHNPYQSPLLNKIWEIFPIFVVWKLWIEVNKITFEDKFKKEEDIWDTMKNHILEMHALTMNPIETQILQYWGITYNLDYIGNPKPTIFKKISPKHWSMPPPKTFKLNFDEASKGNP